MKSYKGIFTFWLFKKNGPIIFVQNLQDCSSNCPEQNGKQNWGVTSHHKFTLLHNIIICLPAKCGVCYKQIFDIVNQNQLNRI
jgi:hypothetical protein